MASLKQVERERSSLTPEPLALQDDRHLLGTVAKASKPGLATILSYHNNLPAAEDLEAASCRPRSNPDDDSGCYMISGSSDDVGKSDIPGVSSLEMPCLARTESEMSLDAYTVDSDLRERDLFDFVDVTYALEDRLVNSMGSIKDRPRTRQPRKDKGYMCECGKTFARSYVKPPTFFLRFLLINLLSC